MPDKHPILIFNDIKFEQLKSLVAFIYNGSVNVSESNIHAFLNAAQSLLIKGLSEESKNEEKNLDGIKKSPKNVEIQDMKVCNEKSNAKPPILKKPGVYFDPGKNFKKQRQTSPKADGRPIIECEESLSNLQEISFTKSIHQSFNSKIPLRPDGPENKWNGPSEEKTKNSDFYFVKSWTHNSVEDMNDKHKISKNNGIKKIKLEKPINPQTEEVDQIEKNKVTSEPVESLAGNQSEKNKIDEVEDKIKKEEGNEQIMLIEPKQELIEEEDTNSEDNILSSSTDTLMPDSDSLYDGRSVPNFFQPPVVDRGVPVPLLMCRTSLSEPESVEPNWMPQITGNVSQDHPPHSALDNKAQDLQCQTCVPILPCPTCRKKYKSRYALNRHILYECGKARKSFSCDECGKKVTRQDTLQKHKLIHLVEYLKFQEKEKLKKKGRNKEKPKED